MNFVFDLDETLVIGDVIKMASKELYYKNEIGKIYTGEDVVNTNLDPLPDNLKKLVREYFTDPHVNQYHKEIIKGTNTLLYYLVSKGHNVSILTARPLPVQKATVDFVWEKYNSLFIGSRFVSPINTYFSNAFETCDPEINVSKKYILRQLKPDFYFDDNPQHCLEAIDIVQNIYLIKNKYTGWNRNFNHERINELKSVIEFNVRHYGI